MCCEGKGTKSSEGSSCCKGQKDQHHGMRHGFKRLFISKDEKIQKLEKYREDLQKEIKGLDEHIKEMKS